MASQIDQDVDAVARDQRRDFLIAQVGGFPEHVAGIDDFLPQRAFAEVQGIGEHFKARAVAQGQLAPLQLRRWVLAEIGREEAEANFPVACRTRWRRSMRAAGLGLDSHGQSPRQLLLLTRRQRQGQRGVVQPHLLQRRRRAPQIGRQLAHVVDEAGALGPVALLLPLQQARQADLARIQSQSLRHGDAGGGRRRRAVISGGGGIAALRLRKSCTRRFVAPQHGQRQAAQHEGFRFLRCQAQGAIGCG